MAKQKHPNIDDTVAAAEAATETAADSELAAAQTGVETQPVTSSPAPQGPSIPFTRQAAPKKPVTVAELVAVAKAKGQETVTMVIPQQKHKGPVLVRLPDKSLVSVPTGIQEVTADLADHWFLKAAGAKRHTK
jgi:hypothetical protein